MIDITQIISITYDDLCVILNISKRKYFFITLNLFPTPGASLDLIVVQLGLNIQSGEASPHYTRYLLLGHFTQTSLKQSFMEIKSTDATPTSMFILFVIKKFVNTDIREFRITRSLFINIY